MALFILIFTAFLGLVLTQLLRQPRPYWLGEVFHLATETTYANPSSQASASLAVLGYLAYRINKEWLWAASRSQRCSDCLFTVVPWCTVSSRYFVWMVTWFGGNLRAHQDRTDIFGMVEQYIQSRSEWE